MCRGGAKGEPAEMDSGPLELPKEEHAKSSSALRL